MVWLEDDSRGFQLVKISPLAGDPGGYSSHHWQASAVTRQGSEVRLSGRTYIQSPDGYRLRTQMSVDGEPFANFDTLRWERVEDQ